MYPMEPISMTTKQQDFQLKSFPYHFDSIRMVRIRWKFTDIFSSPFTSLIIFTFISFIYEWKRTQAIVRWTQTKQ